MSMPIHLRELRASVHDITTALLSVVPLLPPLFMSPHDYAHLHVTAFVLYEPDSDDARALISSESKSNLNAKSNY
jgi:hypothetical protein